MSDGLPSMCKSFQILAVVGRVTARCITWELSDFPFTDSSDSGICLVEDKASRPAPLWLKFLLTWIPEIRAPDVVRKVSSSLLVITGIETS